MTVGSVVGALSVAPLTRDSQVVRADKVNTGVRKGSEGGRGGGESQAVRVDFNVNTGVKQRKGQSI